MQQNVCAWLLNLSGQVLTVVGVLIAGWGIRGTAKVLFPAYRWPPQRMVAWIVRNAARLARRPRTVQLSGRISGTTSVSGSLSAELIPRRPDSYDVEIPAWLRNLDERLTNFENWRQSHERATSEKFGKLETQLASDSQRISRELRSVEEKFTSALGGDGGRGFPRHADRRRAAGGRAYGRSSEVVSGL